MSFQRRQPATEEDADEMADVVVPRIITNQQTNNRQRRFSAWDVAPIEGADWHQSVGLHFEDGNESSFPLFIEMVELVHSAGFGGRSEWRESARWVKYEEAVEKDSNRWSKPYVSSLTLPSLDTVRMMLDTQIVELEFEGIDSLRGLFVFIVDGWMSAGVIQESQRDRILEALTRRHVHLYERVKEYKLKDYVSPVNVKIKNRGGSRRVRHTSSSSGGAGGISGRRPSSVSIHRGDMSHLRKEAAKAKKNCTFMKKIPSGAEACNIFVGELAGLDQSVCAFVRIANPTIIGNITEVPVPTRFVFVLLSPLGQFVTHCEVARAMGALMSDPAFKATAYKATGKKDLLAGIDTFLTGVTVLPPAAWDSTIRIEPINAPHEAHLAEDPLDAEELRRESGLTRSGRVFGGLIADIRRKIPFYASDFRDALSPQCLATWIFLYFACLTPMITFGGILGKATGNYMGTMEVMVAGCLCGVIFALFGGQPLLILGSTGPMLIFEKIVINVCTSMDLAYLEFRLWIGIWIGIVLLILVATDASAFVSFITRFTEENFATLVACIFIMEAVKNVLQVKEHNAATEAEDALKRLVALRTEDEYGNVTDLVQNYTTTTNSTLSSNYSEEAKSIFFMSIILFAGTFLISFLLKELRNSSFFPTFIRYLLSDFAVVLAIVAMSTVDYLTGVRTPKLVVPREFAPTIPTRGWLVSPFGENDWWTPLAASVPALLATILIFMDQQITAVIINRKDHKLKKGCGYHLDLFVLAILIVVCSFLGLPWFIAATVESLTNMGSLKMESESAAPGEKPQFLGVREQRMTNILIFTTVGLSVFITKFLEVVPMPVLYGVFLYMGFSALRKMELFERILLVLMPTKYQPDHMYLRVVPTVKVHLYTLIQITSLALLWIIKSIPQTAIMFPLMLLVMMLIRKLLEFVFTQKELGALDDLLPGSEKKTSSNNNNKDVNAKLLDKGNDTKI